jgi:centromeric protein E
MLHGTFVFFLLLAAKSKERKFILIGTSNILTINLHCSSEKRSGHIPYRDSKLTRILQLSLGGNARTAIICTMSPALTHVEQSRNTLFFAACAKEVTNTAKVNMVRTATPRFFVIPPRFLK